MSCSICCSWLLQGLTQLLADALAVVLDGLLFFTRELVVGLGIDDLAITQRRQGKAGRCTHQDDAGRACLGFHCIDQGFLLPLEAVLEPLQGVAVFVAVEGGGQRGGERLDQIAHGALQRPAGAAGQAQGTRLVGGAEIVDVTPVAGRFVLQGLLLEQLPDNCMLAKPRRAHHVEVVTLVGDSHAKVQRAHGPFLAGAQKQIVQIFTAYKVSGQFVAGMVELLGQQGMGGGHGVSPCAMPLPLSKDHDTAVSERNMCSPSEEPAGTLFARRQAGWISRGI